MKILKIIAAIMAVFLFVTPVFAKSGCCSHHQGVCGCSCCDGSPLSATCRPYYPECNGSSSNQSPSSPTESIPQNSNQDNTSYQQTEQIVYPTWTPYPTAIPKSTPTATPSPTITSPITPTVEVSPTVDIPSPTITVFLNVTTATKTQEGGLGGIINGFFSGLFNLLTFNLFNKPAPTPTPIPSPVPTATPAPTITPTPTIVIAIGVRTKTSDCKINNTLPDRTCTPGDIISAATKEEICTSGYTKTVRNVPASEKNEVYAEYGIINHQTGEYEVDHLISLELGGSNDISNLWPEAADPRPGSHEKDKVENYLHDQVCSGIVPLQQAQQEIAVDWVSVYNQMLGK